MGDVWSTRELAELAGTTVNAVRHYHRAGLLEEPGRRANGYKQYRVPHLVRLLQIRRLRELGVSLEGISDFGTFGAPGAPGSAGAAGAAGAGGAGEGQGHDDGTRAALHVLDAELASTIARLQRARTEVAAILEHGSPAGLPAGFETVAPLMSEADRSIVSIYGQLYDEEAMADVRGMIAAHDDEASRALDAEFNGLAAEAEDGVRQDLAERMAPALARHLEEFPWLLDPAGHLSREQGEAQRVFTEAMAELYNPAQRDVLHRALNLTGRGSRPR